MIRCPSLKKSYLMNFRFLSNIPQILAVCERCSNLAHTRVLVNKKLKAQYNRATLTFRFLLAHELVVDDVSGPCDALF